MQKNNHKAFLVLLLGTLSAFGPFVIDFYLPALPQLVNAFNSSTSMAQLSLTASMVGLALGQLLLGSVSDRFGRKKPLMMSLVIYTISSILIIFAPNIQVFIVLRLIQGLAASGGVVISRAVATDLYRGQEMSKFFGLLMTVNGVAPIISPVIGSQVLEYINWQGIFICLSVIGILLLLASTRLVESLTPDNRLQGNLLNSYTSYFFILKNKRFMMFVSLSALIFAGLFAYIACSPFIFQKHYGLSAMAFSLCFAMNGLAMVLGSNLSGRLPLSRALDIACISMFIFSFFISACLIFKVNVWVLEFGFFIFLFFLGMAIPAVSALAMNEERKRAGSASAVLGFFPFFIGALVSPLVGIGNIFYATALVMLISSILLISSYAMIKIKMRTSPF